MRENLAAVLHGVGDLRLEARPVPEPGPGEVLIEVRSVGVCGSDVHYYEHGRIGDFVVRAPFVLGHEAAGTVVATGPDTTRHEPGQRVAIEPGVPCGRCGECRTGSYNLCPDVRFLATPPVDGAFARFLCVPESHAYPLPDRLSDDAGALIEPLAVAVWANRKAGTTVGSRILVTGAGPIGVLAAQVALASGGTPLVIDVNRDRLDAAVRLGIENVRDAEDESAVAGFAPDILLECTGVESVVQRGIEALVPGGVAVLVGMGTGPVQELPVARIQARELAVTGTFRYAHAYPAAIELAASGRVRLDEMVGARLPLEDAERALTMARTDPRILKTMVVVAR